MRLGFGIASVLALALLAGCGFVTASDAPCSSDSNCPTGYVCGGTGTCIQTPPKDAGPETDSGTLKDSGSADSGPVDSGFMDAGHDSGPVDGGEDAGPADSGELDSGPADSGPEDAGPPDSGPEDAGPPDGGWNPLVISEVQTDHPLYSAQPTFNLVTLTFDTSEAVYVPLDGSGTSLSVTIGNPAVEMTCLPYSATTPNITCTYMVTGSETPGAQPIEIVAMDAAGHVTNASASTTFQFAPSIVGNPSVTYTPAPNNILPVVWEATIGTTVTIAFTTSSPLKVPPKVTTKPPGFRFASTSLGPDCVAAMTIPSVNPPDDRKYSFQFALTDTVGNTANLAPDAPTFTASYGTLPPYTEYGGISYVRVPWGDAASDGGPAFYVTGFGNGFAVVNVFDGPDPATAQVIGTSVLNDDGGYFTTPLTGGDRTNVYIGGIDLAGNVSDLSSVHDTYWIATFNGKVAGRDGGNPNVMYAAPGNMLNVIDNGPVQQQAEILGVMHPGPAVAPEVSDYSGLYVGSQTPLVTTEHPQDWYRTNQPASPPARIYSAAAYDSQRGVTVLFGGQGNAGNLSDTWEWNGIKWTERLPADFPVARQGHAMVYDSFRGVTVMFGGSDGNPLNDIWEWDGVNWVQQAPADTPSKRVYHAMAFDSARGVTVLFGGNDGMMDLQDTWTWDGLDWTLRPQMNNQLPTQRQGHVMAYDSAHGVTVMFGGDYSNTTLRDTWYWDGQNWNIIFPGHEPESRWHSGMVYDSLREVMVLFGGANDPTGTWADTEFWDGTALDWFQQTPVVSPSELDGYAMAYDSGRGKTVLFGGGGMGGRSANLTWEWDGVAWTQPSPGVTPPARMAHAMAYDSTNADAVLFGGWVGTGAPMQDTWQWNGSNWAEKTPNTLPPARYSQAMAFDSKRNITWMFGGDGETSLLNDTWGWDGTDWTLAVPPGSPPARESFALAYDSTPNRALTVMFGGKGGSGDLQDTWVWNGSNWVEKSTTVSPTARDSHAMSFDSVRRVTVLFGGTSGSGELQDTWEWNGSSWAEMSPPSSPPARQNHAMVFDSERGVTVMSGGTGGGQVLNDTWLWNGSVWMQQPTTSVLPARDGFAMAYDSTRGQSIIFGGVETTGTPVNDTWLLPSALNGYPTDIANIDLTGINETFSQAPVDYIGFTVIVGGTGYTPGSGSMPVTGAAIAAWDVTVGAWRILNTNDYDSITPGNLVIGTDSWWEASRYLIEPTESQNESVDVALFPYQTGGIGPVPGALAVNDLEVTVEYSHVESACTFEDGGQTCVCADDEVVCNSVCVATEMDPHNCGGCAGTDGGTICPANTICSGGGCVCPNYSETLCEGICTDTNIDAVNCGGCATGGGGDGGVPAGIVCTGTSVCINGGCVCPNNSLTYCSGVCTDTTSDPYNCGGCAGTDGGTVCNGTYVCSDGGCVQ